MMWHELTQQSDLDELMQFFGSFHDSCIKQLFIRNREFVDERLSMSFNNAPMVRLLFQWQFRNPSAIEIQFEEVEFMNWRHDNLKADSGLTLIYEAVLQFKNGLLYWAEDIDWSEGEGDKNEFRWIAARTGKWRALENGLGVEDL